MPRTLFVGVILSVFTVYSALAMSPYEPSQEREIKALTPETVADYLNGSGSGLALAAELNGYPGPAHVLEHAALIGLTQAQRKATEALRTNMRARASELGHRIVVHETELDALFATDRATPEAVRALTATIAKLQGDLRAVHLITHISQRRALEPGQLSRYLRARG